MNYLSKFCLFIAVFYLNYAIVFSNQVQNVIIKEIISSETGFNFDNFNDIVIASSDTILFRYTLDIPQNTPFLYTIKITNKDETSERTAGLTEVQYSNLDEGEYFFEVSAFALRGE